MPRLPPERTGDPMLVLNHEVEFSFWPMAQDTRRFSLQSRLFASDPLNIIEQVVNRDCPVPVKPVALAYLEQARDFFAASQFGAVRAARPLLIYYAFMNLAKAFVLTKGTVTTSETPITAYRPYSPRLGQDLPELSLKPTLPRQVEPIFSIFCCGRLRAAGSLVILYMTWTRFFPKFFWVTASGAAQPRAANVL